MSKKVLVAYFSASGVTKKVAENVAKSINADIFEIVPEVAYTNADLNWIDKKSRSTIEMNNPNSRPAIASKLPEPVDYNTVFVGFPIWWYTAPTIIKTFLESYDFNGVKIVPFATSGSSGMGSISKTLQATVPSANVVEGKLLNHMNASQIKQWAESVM